MKVAIDLDGVVVRLYPAIISLYGLPGKLADTMTTGGSIADVLTYHSQSSKTWSGKVACSNATEASVWERVSLLPGSWWAGLKPDPAGMLLVAKLRARGVEVVPISQPLLLGRNDAGYGASCEGKRRWMDRNLPELSADLVLTAAKHKCARPDTILVDDSPAKVEAWRKAGGPAVLWYQPWNRRSAAHVRDEHSLLLHLEAGRELPHDLGA